MKRIRLLVLAGAIAAAIPFGMTAAGATGGTGSTNSVTIQQYADYDAAGFVLDVGLYVTCKGNGTFAEWPRRRAGGAVPAANAVPRRFRLGPAVGRV